MSKSIVITGATSFLGRNILKYLMKYDYNIYAFVRESSKDLWRLPKDNRVVYIYGDLDAITCVLDYVEKADYFIHFAWEGSGNIGRASEEVQNRNIQYSKDALKIACKLGCQKFFFSGSQAEYGICKELITEETKCQPLSAYGKAKMEFSEFAKGYCADKMMQFFHLRIFSIYGPDDREGTLVDICIKGFNSGHSVELGPCVHSWNYLYIQDFVELIHKMIQKNCKSGIYNVASDDTRPLKEFVLEIYKLSNKSGKYRFGKINNNPEDSPFLNPEIKKLKNEVDWQPQCTFEDGINRIMKENRR